MKVVPKDKSANMAVSANDVLELQIALRGCEPKVDRTLLVSAAITFGELHECIQIAMGWENAHLHEFKLGKTRVGMEAEEDFFGDADVIQEDQVRLYELLPECKGRFSYWYDFGDDWMHEIRAKVVPAAKAKGMELPACIAGSGACPPEDCGGVPGYMHLLEQLRSGSPQQKEDARAWLGDRAVPERFDLEAADRALRR